MTLSIDQYAVIGNPIAQSKSPLIHASFALATQQSLQYSRIEGRMGQFAADVDAFRARGGRGLNITAPFKLDAFSYATVLSERAKLAGAINAMKFEGDTVYGENFDGMGITRDVTHNLRRPLKGQRVLILGAGGAARGLLEPFLAEQPAQLFVANRNVDKALAFVNQFARLGKLQAGSYQQLAGQEFDIVFNATSASLLAQLPPVPASVFAPGCLAYELAYGKGLTPFLQAAKAAGVTQLADGVGMLAEQAALAFEWWRGVRPSTQDVIKQLTVPLV